MKNNLEWNLTLTQEDNDKWNKYLKESTLLSSYTDVSTHKGKVNEYTYSLDEIDIKTNKIIKENVFRANSKQECWFQMGYLDGQRIILNDRLGYNAKPITTKYIVVERETGVIDTSLNFIKYKPLRDK